MNDNLNAIRLCLAMLVLFSHSFAVLDAPQPQVLGWDLGSHAVHAFFAISGYLVVGSYMRRPNIVQFAVNRILRITPALLVACVFGHGLFEWYGQYGGNPLPLRQNNSLWTIPWEITCYAACAAAGAIGLLHRDRYNVIFALAWVMVLASLGPGEDYALILPMLLSFLTGGFIAVYEDGINIRHAVASVDRRGDMALATKWAIGRGADRGGQVLSVNAGSDAWNHRSRAWPRPWRRLVPRQPLQSTRTRRPTGGATKSIFRASGSWRPSISPGPRSQSRLRVWLPGCGPPGSTTRTSASRSASVCTRWRGCRPTAWWTRWAALNVLIGPHGPCPPKRPSQGCLLGAEPDDQARPAQVAQVSTAVLLSARRAQVIHKPPGVRRQSRTGAAYSSFIM